MRVVDQTIEKIVACLALGYPDVKY